MLVIISFECIFSSSIGHAWLEFRRNEMFYTEHKFQVDLENFEFNLKFHAEKIQESVDNILGVNCVIP